MNLIGLVITIVLISIISIIDISYVSVSGVKVGQEKNNYSSFISLSRNIYSEMILSDGSFDNEDDKKDFMMKIMGDEMFMSPILSDGGTDGYYLCIEKVLGREKVSAAKEIVKSKSKISFFILDCKDYETKTQDYQDGAYIAFFLEK